MGSTSILTTTRTKMATTNQIVLCIVAIFISPLAIALHMGIKNWHFWINIVLYLCTWILGVLHGIYVILTRPGFADVGAHVPEKSALGYASATPQLVSRVIRRDNSM